MKILIAYTNGNGYGGCELMHYELIQGLSKYKNLDITVATYTKPNLDFHLWQDITKLGIKVKTLQGLSQTEDKFDLVLVSQPYPTTLLCHLYPTTPKISIIHSVIRGEEPIKHESIKKTVSVQVDIKKGLRRFHNIDSELIFNPVDPTRFNKEIHTKKQYPFIRGVFVGEANDPLRAPMLDHLVQNCIQNEWHLDIISRGKRDFNTDLVSFVEPCYNTENYLKNADFAAGLLGRVAIESYMCGVPFYGYEVDYTGRILGVKLVSYMKTRRFETSFVSSQYYDLIKKYGN